MSEREKLKAVFEAFELELMETRGGFTAAGRRFFFDEAGQLRKIIFGPREDRKIVKAGEKEAAE